ncbi:MAG: hypothetical protein NT123_08400 [Proteobacteria bacterium]|nr:hypothetical protein [Pseudomonadota bacterium]
MIKTVFLHADAPSKPAEGETCNGCGICCAAERCPVAWLFLPRNSESCAALQWDAEARRYHCGMVVHPADFLRWLPRRWEGQAGRWFAYRVAAGKGCDFGAVEVGDT